MVRAALCGRPPSSRPVRLTDASPRSQLPLPHRPWLDVWKPPFSAWSFRWYYRHGVQRSELQSSGNNGFIPWNSGAPTSVRQRQQPFCQFEALVSLGNGDRVTYRVRLTTLLGRVSHTIEEQYGDQRMHALPWLAYGLRMTQVDPLRSSRNDSTQLFCATCGHSEAAHSNSGDRRCLRSICSCHKFIVGAVVDLTAQVLSS